MRHAFKVIHHAAQINSPARSGLLGYRIPGVRAAGFNVVLKRMRIVISWQTYAAGVDDGDEVATCWAGHTASY